MPFVPYGKKAAKKRRRATSDALPLAGSGRPSIHVRTIDVRTTGGDQGGRVQFKNLDLLADPSGPVSPSTRSLEAHLGSPLATDLPPARSAPNAPHPAGVIIEDSSAERAIHLGLGDLTVKNTEVPGVGHFAAYDKVTRGDGDIVATIATNAGQPSAVAVQRHHRKDTGASHRLAANALAEALTARDKVPMTVLWVEEQSSETIPKRHEEWSEFADLLLEMNGGRDVVPVQVTFVDLPIVASVMGRPGYVSEHVVDVKTAIEAACVKKGGGKYPAEVRAQAILALISLHPLTAMCRDELEASRFPALGGYKEAWLLPLEQTALQLTLSRSS